MSCFSTACCRRHPRACAAVHAHHRLANMTGAALPLSGSEQSFEPAKRIFHRLALDDAIAVTHTTAANLEFARNWYLHLQRASVSNYALIATDDVAHATLAREVVGHVVTYPLGPKGVAQAAQSYRSRGWTRLMFAVPRMLHWVLAMGLDVLWMDTDVVALSDPFPLIRQHAAAATAAAAAAAAAATAAAKAGTTVPRIASASVNADNPLSPRPRGLLLASVDGRVPDERLAECGRYYSHDPRWRASSGTSKLCGGLFFARSSAATIALALDWERRVNALNAGQKNQPHFNAALDAARNVHVALLPCAQFPNGARYASPAWRRAQLTHPQLAHPQLAHPQAPQQDQGPVLVHNNWIKGHAAKRARFREWGLWRVNATGGSPAEHAPLPALRPRRRVPALQSGARRGLFTLHRPPRSAHSGDATVVRRVRISNPVRVH